MARKSLTEMLCGVTQFGDYKVLREGKYSPKGRYAFCECKCGAQKDVEVPRLLSGRSTCCKDCAKTSSKRRTSVTHGLSRSSEYGIYKGMISRCTNAADERYRYYGAKGIGVCERWLESFENFYADMGPRPSANHSIDRVNNTLGYSPENCRWADSVTQQSNRDCTLKVMYKGECVALSILAKEHGLSPATLAARVNAMGWSIEKALSEPVKDKTPPLHNVQGRMLTSSQIESEFGVKRLTFNARIRRGMSVMQAIGLG